MKNLYFFLLAILLAGTACREGELKPEENPITPQVAREDADEIVLEYINIESWPYTVYVKENVQAAGTTITTTAGEILKFDSLCWVYCIDYANNAASTYLLVNGNNGNLLEINTRSNAMPDDLAEWKVIAPIELPFTKCFFMGCDWSSNWSGAWRRDTWSKLYRCDIALINSNEDFEKYVYCRNDYPVVDFSKQTLITAMGGDLMWRPIVVLSATSFFKVGREKYILTVNDYGSPWFITIIAPKVSNDATIVVYIQSP